MHTMQLRVATPLLLVLCVLVSSVGLERATARKELPLNTAFPPVVQDALRCDVCAFIVANSLNHVEAKRDELRAKRLALREDDVLEETENLCIPFKDQGQWIRQVSLQVAPKSSQDASEGHQMEVGVVNFYGRCGRTCDTVAALCEELMDRDVMDDFPGQLLKVSKDANMADEAHRDAVFHQFCYASTYCKLHQKYVVALEKELRTNVNLLEEMKADKPRRMKKEELEMETMMYRLMREQRQSADVFSRDEIRKMQQAFIHGTKEDVAAVDPKAFDLSDEEFVALREHMRADERVTGGNRRGQKQEGDEDGDL
ncbi:putative mitochondrial hypothetical protein [Leptomonas pyrrhocoris]|uniref:DUF3456 domain-containing protein n=1 Tax=Leptomonas pyrrhocoris TaxID=157538 RepID=A0A0N0VFN2_LEPPY|nr:putative mitochondrial hypothetical protein [Leptomonas pyrrhocoris]KPA81678.1 putative mitochondrial hypothetical protein [Leptomonas pyrrhocoris]|eukprot:XP_015660117.1 putative mitochondrial hypothetical protein [Leptomonas pyrrhocoris]